MRFQVVSKVIQSVICIYQTDFYTFSDFQQIQILQVKQEMKEIDSY